MLSDTKKTHDDLKVELTTRFRVFAAETLRDTGSWPNTTFDDFVFMYKIISQIEFQTERNAQDINRILDLLKRMNETQLEISEKHNGIFQNIIGYLYLLKKKVGLDA